jgi:hypothetical protein
VAIAIGQNAGTLSIDIFAGLTTGFFVMANDPVDAYMELVSINRREPILLRSFDHLHDRPLNKLPAPPE